MVVNLGLSFCRLRFGFVVYVRFSFRKVVVVVVKWVEVWVDLILGNDIDL